MNGEYTAVNYYVYFSRNAEEILKDIFSLDLQIFGFRGYNFAIKLSIEERLAAKIPSSGNNQLLKIMI